MTDPFADLERELLAAHGRDHGPRRRLAGAGRAVAMPATVAAVAIAFAVLAVIATDDDPERAAAPPAPAGISADCGAPGRRFQPAVSDEPPPAAIAERLAVLREGVVPADVDRFMVGGQATRIYGSWATLGPMPERTLHAVAAEIIPRSEVTPDRDICAAPSGTLQPGVCMHIGMPDAQGGTVACFTVEELEGGRAFIDLDGEVIGLAPDGARTAIVGEAHTTVEGNLFVLPGGPESVVEFRS